MNSIWVRLAFWLTLLVLVIAGRIAWDSMRSGQQAFAEHSANETALDEAGPGIARRPATIAEWRLDIAALGRRALGKRLIWRPLQRQDEGIARGHLVWWHDGQSERIGYAPAGGEDPTAAVMGVMQGLQSGRVVLYDAHGDPELITRLFDEIPANWVLPQGLTVLDPPLPGGDNGRVRPREPERELGE